MALWTCLKSEINGTSPHPIERKDDSPP
jgi:hypothetical protein